jgi:hypothetical protein
MCNGMCLISDGERFDDRASAPDVIVNGPPERECGSCVGDFAPEKGSIAMSIFTYALYVMISRGAGAIRR